MYTETRQIHCPYCGESIEIIVDTSIDEQRYVEDCSVCCRPIEMHVVTEGDAIQVTPTRDDE